MGEKGFVGVGMGVTVLVYTHSSMMDILPGFLGRLEKFLPEKHKVYIAVDAPVPVPYEQVFYDDNDLYTDRLKKVLKKIKEETVLFIHEDMILYGEVDMVRLLKYQDYVSRGVVSSVKLILVGDSFTACDVDSELVTNSYARFSVQPTLINTKYFLDLVSRFPRLTIWGFEESVSSGFLDVMPRLGGEAKRGLYHYDSIVFPYVATGVTKGKWLMSEYPRELSEFVSEYGIDVSVRGVV